MAELNTVFVPLKGDPEATELAKLSRAVPGVPPLLVEHNGGHRAAATGVQNVG